MTVALPPVCDLAFYRKSNPDLRSLSDAQLTEHYLRFGRAEGRVGSAAALRENFLEYAAQHPSVLEIGPFCNPCLRGRGVKYFDVLDRQGLIDRAKRIGYPHADAPEIDFVSPAADLTIVSGTFSSVVSSHCVEHQPDLIRHFKLVARCLDEGGRYFLLIPDKRYCFDHFIAESTLANVIDAHIEGRTVHRLASVIEHRALTTHNDAARHWRGDHVDPGHESSMVARTRMALAEVDAAKGGYVDVHAWQFTPESFHRIISMLNELDFIALEAERVYDTPIGRNEFTAVLRKPVH